MLRFPLIVLSITLMLDAARAEEPVRLLLLGDSIRIGYAPIIKKKLGDSVTVISFPTNGGDSANTLKKLDDWLKKAKPDVVVFNNGLHDLKFDKATQTHQVPIEQYAENMEAILMRIRKTTDKVAFADTTPIDDSRHAQRKAPFDRFNADVRKYNDAARKVMIEHYVTLIDLYDLMRKNDPEKMLLKDGTHFTEKAKELQADAILKTLRGVGWIPKKP